MSDNPEPPLISIGMPIFNEGRFLLESLEALVRQDHPNIEFIIADNASTDETSAICTRYAERYPWIQYHRHEKNIGPGANFAFVRAQATGSYFMWASGHDLWAPDYLSSCVAQLSTRKDAAIAFGSCSWIDGAGNCFGREYGCNDTRGLDTVSRYFSVFWGNMHPILGLIRTEWLKNLPLINTVGADLILLTQLSLQGNFIHVPGTQWSRREFRTEASYADKLERYKSHEYGLASSKLQKAFPLLRLPLELIRGVARAKIPLAVKLSIMLLLLPTLPIKYLAGRR